MDNFYIKAINPGSDVNINVEGASAGTISAGSTLNVDLNVTPDSYFITGTTLNINVPTGTTSSELWERPADWLEIDSYVTEGGSHIFIGLFAVFPDKPNKQTITSSQAFTVNIDGSTTNYAANAQAYLNFTYSAIDSATTTSEGFRQVRIQVYPQTGNWTGTLNISAAITVGAAKPTHFNSNFIDIRMYAPTLSTYTTLTTAGGRLLYLKKHNWIGKNTSTVRSAFIGTSLRWIGDNFSGASSLTSFLSYTPAINQFIDPNNIQNINFSGTANQSFFTSSRVRYVGNITETATANTNLGSFFSNSSELLSVGNITSPRTTTMASFFNACYSLTGTGTISAISATTFASAFFNCYMLQKTGPITSGLLLTNVSNAFNGCRSLREVSFSQLAGVSSAANASGVLTECTSLSAATFTGLRFGFTVPPCQMNDTAFANLFTSLGTASGSQTIVITGNITLSAPTLAIATGKGYTVTP